jgi:hypothetical protein
VKTHPDGHALLVALEREYGMPEDHAERVLAIIQKHGFDTEPIADRGYIEIKKVGRTFVITERF